MKITEFEIEGPKLLTPRKFGDDRGFFTERYRADQFAEAGFKQIWVQENYSRSAPGILRGLHYQWDGPQGKLVTCTGGKILDVAVDIRKNSKTFGRHVSVTLDSAEPAWFWGPAGFAHGFCVLGDQPADLLYKVDFYYNAQGEGGIAWDDPELKIAWPTSKPRLSPKDEVQPKFSAYAKAPRF